MVAKEFVFGEWRLDIGTTQLLIGSDVPWLDFSGCNALTWVITVTE